MGIREIAKQVTAALLFFAWFAVPSLVSAGVEIREIMYDVSGADTGREWIEIINTGGEPVDAATLK